MSVDIVANASLCGGPEEGTARSDKYLPPSVHMSAVPATLRRPTTRAHFHRPYYCFL
jgi:hypothetical protein